MTTIADLATFCKTLVLGDDVSIQTRISDKHWIFHKSTDIKVQNTVIAYPALTLQLRKRSLSADGDASGRSDIADGAAVIQLPTHPTQQIDAPAVDNAADIAAAEAPVDLSTPPLLRPRSPSPGHQPSDPRSPPVLRLRPPSPTRQLSEPATAAVDTEDCSLQFPLNSQRNLWTREVDTRILKDATVLGRKREILAKTPNTVIPNPMSIEFTRDKLGTYCTWKPGSRLHEFILARSGPTYNSFTIGSILARICTYVELFHLRHHQNVDIVVSDKDLKQALGVQLFHISQLLDLVEPHTLVTDNRSLLASKESQWDFSSPMNRPIPPSEAVTISHAGIRAVPSAQLYELMSDIYSEEDTLLFKSYNFHVAKMHEYLVSNQATFPPNIMGIVDISGSTLAAILGVDILHPLQLAYIGIRALSPDPSPGQMSLVNTLHTIAPGPARQRASKRARDEAHVNGLLDNLSEKRKRDTAEKLINYNPYLKDHLDTSTLSTPVTNHQIPVHTTVVTGLADEDFNVSAYTAYFNLASSTPLPAAPPSSSARPTPAATGTPSPSSARPTPAATGTSSPSTARPPPAMAGPPAPSAARSSAPAGAGPATSSGASTSKTVKGDAPVFGPAKYFQTTGPMDLVSVPDPGPEFKILFVRKSQQNGANTGTPDMPVPAAPPPALGAVSRPVPLRPIAPRPAAPRPAAPRPVVISQRQQRTAADRSAEPSSTVTSADIEGGNTSG